MAMHGRASGQAVARPGALVRVGHRVGHLGLRLRIALLVAVAVLAVAGLLGGVVGAASAEQARQLSGQELANDADRLADRLDRELAAHLRQIELLGAAAPVLLMPAAPDETPVVTALLGRLRATSAAFGWIGVTDPNGRVLAATDAALVGADLSADVAIGAADALRGAAQPGLARNASALIEGGSGRMLDMVHPIIDAQGVVRAAIVAQLRWDAIARLMDSALDHVEPPRRQKGRQALLVGGDGRVLMGPAPLLGHTLVLDAIRRARTGSRGWIVQRWPDGQDYLTGFADAAGGAAFVELDRPAGRLVMLVRSPVGLAFGPANRLRRDTLLAGLVLAVVFAGLGWLAAGWISAPLARMATCAERLRGGDDVEMPLLGGAHEIRSLSISLRALVAALTDRRLAVRELERLTTHDPLTGVLNRAGLRNYLDAAMAERPRGWLLLFLADLDGFKEVNDRLGHAAGDAVLREVAARLKACLRQGDGVARFGGDEFAMVLLADGAEDAAARRVAERMLAEVGQPCLLGRDVARVGISIGGAVWPSRGGDGVGIGIDEVIRRADLALYASKRAGKERLTMYETMAR